MEIKTLWDLALIVSCAACSLFLTIFVLIGVNNIFTCITLRSMLIKKHGKCDYSLWELFWNEHRFEMEKVER